MVLESAAVRRVDSVAGELYHILLELWNSCSNLGASRTNFVTLHSIRDKVREKKNECSPALGTYLEHYLKVLSKMRFFLFQI